MIEVINNLLTYAIYMISSLLEITLRQCVRDFLAIIPALPVIGQKYLLEGRQITFKVLKGIIKIDARQ